VFQKPVLIRVLFRALFTGVVALLLLSAIATWLFPEFTDQMSDSGYGEYVFVVVYLLSASLGGIEGFLHWKKLKKEGLGNL